MAAELENTAGRPNSDLSGPLGETLGPKHQRTPLPDAPRPDILWLGDRPVILPPKDEQSRPPVTTTPREEPDRIVATPEYPLAIEPTVLFYGGAKAYQETIDVDVPGLSEQLRKDGFSDDVANGFALLFHDERESQQGGFSRLAFYAGASQIDYGDRKLFYPLTVGLILPEEETLLNRHLFHEIGHGHQEYVAGDMQISWYNDDDVLAQTKTAGKITAIGGGIIEAASMAPLDIPPVARMGGITLGIFSLALGITINKLPQSILYQIEPGERYARKFERQHRDIRPIRYT